MSKQALVSYIIEHINADNSPLDVKEYITLLALCNSITPATLKCNPGLASLANSCMISERTMNLAIRGLTQKGFITYISGGMRGNLRRANSYTINYDLIYSYTRTPFVVVRPPQNMVPAPPWM